MRSKTSFTSISLQILSSLASIAAGNLTPFPITPTSTATSAEADIPRCTSTNSTSITWEVRDLYYRRHAIAICGAAFTNCPLTTPVIYLGNIVFNLTDTSTGSTQHCDVSTPYLSDVDPRRDDFWIPCDAGLLIFPPDPAPTGVNTTTFRFSHAENKLELNQTWYCSDDTDNMGEGEYEVTAYGAVTPALDPSVRYVNDSSLREVRVNGSSPRILVDGTVVERRLVPVTLRPAQA